MKALRPSNLEQKRQLWAVKVLLEAAGRDTEDPRRWVDHIINFIREGDDDSRKDPDVSSIRS